MRASRKVVTATVFFAGLVVVVIAVAMLLAPATADAQGIIEYEFCRGDYGVLSPDNYELAIYLTDVEPWEADYGLFGYCVPKYRVNRVTGIRELVRISACLQVYRDVEESGSDGQGILSFGDQFISAGCQNIRE